jgi:hypothetical protein
MSEPLVLVILLGSQPDPTAEALMAAARSALGRDAVVLADTSNVRTDAEALAIGEQVHARAVARISWADETHQKARLHVHVATATTNDEWADDEIQFLPQDATPEKGRTVGYTLASMVQRIARTNDETAAPEAPRAAPPRPEAPGEREPRNDVDVFANGVGAIGGGASSGGVAGGLRWWPARFGLRAAGGVRFGHIAEADAATTTLFAAAGPSYRIPVGRDVELGARADFVLLHHAVERRTIVETTRTRWLGAMDLALEGSWALVPNVGLFAAAGAEIAFGTTTVTVGSAQVADIPAVRAIVELGARIRF